MAFGKECARRPGIWGIRGALRYNFVTHGRDSAPDCEHIEVQNHRRTDSGELLCARSFLWSPLGRPR